MLLESESCALVFCYTRYIILLYHAEDKSTRFWFKQHFIEVKAQVTVCILIVSTDCLWLPWQTDAHNMPKLRNTCQTETHPYLLSPQICPFLDFTHTFLSSSSVVILFTHTPLSWSSRVVPSLDEVLTEQANCLSHSHTHFHCIPQPPTKSSLNRLRVCVLKEGQRTRYCGRGQPQVQSKKGC